MTSLELIVITSSLLGLCASFLYFGLVVKEQNKVKLSQLRLDQIKFINDLYDRIYGPWFTVDDWDAFVVDVPIDRIRAFLKDNPEVLKSRVLACDRNRFLVQLMVKNNEYYNSKILSFE